MGVKYDGSSKLMHRRGNAFLQAVNFVASPSLVAQPTRCLWPRRVVDQPKGGVVILFGSRKFIEALSKHAPQKLLRPIIMGSENRKQNRFSPFVVLKPTQGSGFSCSVPKPARTAKKTCFSHTALDGRHESSPHRARNHDQT